MAAQRGGWAFDHQHKKKKHVSAAPAVSGAPGARVTPGQIPVGCVSVADTAAGAKNFTTLLAAAQAAGLAGTLSSPSLVATVGRPGRCSIAAGRTHAESSFLATPSQTKASPPLRPQVFAPTDAAFAKFLKKEKLSAAELLANPTLLKAVLSYHIVAGEALSVAELGSGKNGQLSTLLPGQTLFVSGGSQQAGRFARYLNIGLCPSPWTLPLPSTLLQVDKKVSTNVKTWENTYNVTIIPSGGAPASIIVADVPACQSIIQVIDGVLIPAAQLEDGKKATSLLH